MTRRGGWLMIDPMVVLALVGLATMAVARAVTAQAEHPGDPAGFLPHTASEGAMTLAWLAATGFILAYVKQMLAKGNAPDPATATMQSISNTMTEMRVVLERLANHLETHDGNAEKFVAGLNARFDGLDEKLELAITPRRRR